MRDPGQSFEKIEHFFVLMLENRSFDHLFGDGKTGIASVPLTGAENCHIVPSNPASTKVYVTCNADDATSPDPPHEFQDVYYQLTGNNSGFIYPTGPLPMNGFAASAQFGLLQGESLNKKNRLVAARRNGQYALKCQPHTSATVLQQLAREYVLCEQWHASMPGPTWPNRLFVHAASSGGLDNSPSTLTTAVAMTIDELGFNFEHGTIYDRLGPGGWRVYHGDLFPQILSINKIVADRFATANNARFRRLKNFSDDLQNHPDSIPRYVFIEPYYDVLNAFRRGNSQHPEGGIKKGEELIRYVYESIRNSELWENSTLIITYDEHGGFYDRMSPPVAAAPGDKALNRNKAEFPANFNFNRFGVRVPTLIVSPWVDANIKDDALYDHTSILKTVEERFSLKPLTMRDANANSFSHLFVRREPRLAPDEAPENLSSLAENMVYEEDNQVDITQVEEPDEPMEGNLAGFVRIARLIEHHLDITSRPQLPRLFGYLTTRFVPSLVTAEIQPVTNRKDALTYIRGVADRLMDYDTVSTGQ